MPTYEFRCNGCDTEFDVNMKMSDYDTSTVTCEKCDLPAIRDFRTPTNVEIPTHMQASPNVSKKARLPINFIEEKADGSGYKVTRIGQKKDIENE